VNVVAFDLVTGGSHAPLKIGRKSLRWREQSEKKNRHEVHKRFYDALPTLRQVCFWDLPKPCHLNYRQVMKKSELIAAFSAHLEKDLQALKEAAKATLDAATHEESKAENQYDTRGLEAAYLAGAQAKRATEIEEVLNLFHTLLFKEFGPQDKVDSTALVDIELDGKKSTLLMMPKGGGVSLKLNDRTIQIVTPNSQLGETLIGLGVNEVAEFEVGPKVRECRVLAIV
jgi:hypothetical protein